MLRSVAAAQPLQFFGRALRGDASQDLHGSFGPYTLRFALFSSISFFLIEQIIVRPGVQYHIVRDLVGL